MMKAGPAAVASDAKWYAEAAQKLVALHFHFADYFAQIESPISPVFYIGFVTLVALCQKVLGAHWLWGVLLLNLGVLALTCTLLVCLALRLTGRSSAGLLTLILFLSCLEIFNWARFVLTDALFTGLVAALFYCLVFALIEEKIVARKYGIGALILLLLSPFCRPTGVVLFPIVAVGILVVRWFGSAGVKGKNRAGIVAAICVVLLLISVADAYVMQDTRRWPLPGAEASAEAVRVPYYAKLYHQGAVVNARLETYATPPQTLPDFLALSARRLAYFFAFCSSKGFSRGHNLALSLFFVPAYLLALSTVFRFVRRDERLSREAETALILAIVFVGGFAFFHAHTEIDYDWRYRLPVLPPLILMAALSFASWRKAQ